MADNVVANPGVGGSTFAADDVAGVLFPRSKLVWGIDGVAVDASATDPLPVVQTGTPALPTGAATATKQDTGNTSLASIDGKLTSGIPIVGSVEVMNDAGNPLPVSGTVAVTGVATAANQATEIASLASVDTKLTGVALDATLTGGTQRTKLTDGANNAGINDSTTAANETTMDRLKVNAALRLLDIAQVAGSQLVAAKGDQTSGIWANVKASALPTGAALEAGNLATLVAAVGLASVDTAAASTMLNLLVQLGKKIDATTKAVVALAPKPAVPRSGTTLLHRN